MTFAARSLNLTFSGGQQTLNLQGYRCIAAISNPGGYAPWAQLQLRVYGMSLNHMNQYTSNFPSLVFASNYSVIVTAQTGDKQPAQVFSGGIISSYIDFNSLPEVSMVVVAMAAYKHKVTASADLSINGTQSAQSILASLAPQAGLTPIDHTTQVKNLSNQVLTGSIIDKIIQVSRFAAIPITIENDTLTYWDNTSNKTTKTIVVSPQTGMVGYPSFFEAGLAVKTEFNPNVSIGIQAQLESSITKLNGSFNIITTTHELATELPDGGWFTTFRLANTLYLPKN